MHAHKHTHTHTHTHSSQALINALIHVPVQHWPNAFKPGAGSSFHGDVCPKDGPKPEGCVVFDDEVTMEQTWWVTKGLVV
jgi:hypothetical protein